MKDITFRRLAVVGLVLGWCTLFFGGLTNYPGQKLMYVVFSAVFLVLLVGGLYRPKSYGYLFLVIFLWLGFWFKLTVHLIFGYPYVEPTGSFDGSPGAMDEVLLISSVAGMAVVGTHSLYYWAVHASTIAFPPIGKAPRWYPVSRKWLWTAAVVTVLVVEIVNVVYGVLQVGLVPRTIFIWPINGILSWLLGIGLSMGIVTLVYWDIVLRKGVLFGVYAILAEALLSTVTVLSRGTYIFHTVPAVFSLFWNRQILPAIGMRKLALVFSMYFGLFIVSLVAVTALRAEYYAPGAEPGRLGLSGVVGQIAPGAEPGRLGLSGVVGQIAGLLVDRWIGVEGVMAVCAFPEKGGALIVQALNETREIGQTTLYQDIALSHYRFMDAGKYQFATIPGAPAFFYYSNSLLVVALGMSLLVLFVLVTERVIYVLSGNPILCALYGMDMANTVAQFGLAPRQLFQHIGMVWAAVLLIRFIQSEAFSEALKKSGIWTEAESK